MFGWTVAGLLAFGCGGSKEAAPTPAPSAAPATAAMGTAAVRGVVRYQNGDPDAEIAMDADPACQDLHTEAVHSEKIVADADGNLANAFVYVKSGISGRYPAPSESGLLEQHGCIYQPHVAAVQVGQKVVIRNGDATLHNVHALAKVNAEFNQGQPFQGMEIEKVFDKPEIMIPFKCDVHPWMSSYMAVVEHPFFAVTGADGSFSIEGLPAGDYEIEVWQEELGTQTQSVTVADGGTAELAFEYPAAG
jgi:plastocyanin